MKPLTAAEMEENKIIVPWKVWNWLDKAGEDIFYGYIGYEQADGVMFPHVPAYKRDEFNSYCADRLARQQGATHYSPLKGAYYRPNITNTDLEIAEVENGKLGPWRTTWEAYPPEHAGRI